MVCVIALRYTIANKTRKLQEHIQGGALDALGAYAPPYT